MGWEVYSPSFNISHYGVKGMKWGVRNDPKSTGKKLSNTNSRVKKYTGIGREGKGTTGKKDPANYDSMDAKRRAAFGENRLEFIFGKEESDGYRTYYDIENGGKSKSRNQIRVSYNDDYISYELNGQTYTEAALPQLIQRVTGYSYEEIEEIFDQADENYMYELESESEEDEEKKPKPKPKPKTHKKTESSNFETKKFSEIQKDSTWKDKIKNASKKVNDVLDKIGKSVSSAASSAGKNISSLASSGKKKIESLFGSKSNKSLDPNSRRTKEALNITTKLDNSLYNAQYMKKKFERRAISARERARK